MKEKVAPYRVHADWHRLPMARIEEPDTFEDRDGSVGLAELLEGQPPADVPAG